MNDNKLFNDLTLEVQENISGGSCGMHKCCIASFSKVNLPPVNPPKVNPPKASSSIADVKKSLNNILTQRRSSSLDTALANVRRSTNRRTKYSHYVHH